MRITYLLLAIIGALVPLAFFAGFFADAGFSLPVFARALFVNGAAGGFAADLLITSLVFWIAMFSRPAGPSPWPFIVLNLCIGLSCALPAYLYVLAGRSQSESAVSSS